MVKFEFTTMELECGMVKSEFGTVELEGGMVKSDIQKSGGTYRQYKIAVYQATC